MDDLFGDIDIADLWTPFFCVSTNISRAYRQVHDSGSLRDAIRSSCSIPGLFPPFQLLKQLLVDGGLVDNLPIDVMAESCRGPIIAVDVYPYERHKEDGERRPRKRLVELLARLKPFSYKGPWLFDVLMHATLVGSQYTTTVSLSSHPPALYLVPELEKFRVLDWRAYEADLPGGVRQRQARDRGGRAPAHSLGGAARGHGSALALTPLANRSTPARGGNPGRCRNSS